MGENKWTDEQYRAITKQDADILVAAAAGSGKTAVLVERILRIVCDNNNPIDIDKLLVLTFTKAAAAQMRERIGETINKRLENDSDNMHLQRQLTLLNRAQITTIDAFCLRVVKENYMHVNIDPAFRTADEKECDLIKNQVLDELFEEKYSQEDNSAFLTLVESFGEDKGDSDLRKLVIDIYTFVQSNPFPNNWLNMAAENFNMSSGQGFNESPWGKIVAKSTAEIVDELLNKTATAISIAQGEGGPKTYLDALFSDIDLLEKIKSLNSIDSDKVKEELDNIKFATLGRKKKDDSEQLVQAVKDLRDSVKKGIAELKKDYYFAGGAEIMELNRQNYPIIKALTCLVQDFMEAFVLAKKDKLLVDFNDMEHYALNILLESGSTIENPIPSDVAKNMQKRFYEVLTDEYQDSNLVQEMLLCAISGRGTGAHNRFMVGDVKQSIYRFRQAAPSIFLEKYEKYKEDGNEVKIDLSKNFRSRKNILDAINLLFCQLMTPKVGEITYDEKNALYFGGSFPNFEEEERQCPVELSIINKADVEETFEDEDAEELSTATLEMSYVAKRITEMIDSEFKVFDGKNGYRNLKFSDIVILFRSTPNWVNAASDALTSAGIPSIAPTQSSYFDNTEVAFIVNLLKVVDNFRQDIPIMAVLKSPVYGITDDELLQIKLFSKCDDFCDCVTNYMHNPTEDTLCEKLTKFYKDIMRWKDISAYTPVDRLLWTIYSETGYFDYVGVKRLGKRRQANLRLLTQKAEILEKTNFRGLFNFLGYVEKLTKYSSDDSEAVILNENQDVVKIMTIHKSKGLEFPVVFVCGLGKNFNLMDLKNKVLMHQKDGIGMEFIDHKNRVRYNTISVSLMKQRIKEETLSEEMRVLYVAFTRAKEKLVLTASVKDLHKSCLKWSANLSNSHRQLSCYDISHANSYIDWVASALVRHRDGEAIWDYANIDYAKNACEIRNYVSKWQVNIVQKNEIIWWLKDQDSVVSGKEAPEEAFEHNSDIHRLLNFSYAYKEIARLPANVSVSEIKQINDVDMENKDNFSQLIDPNLELKMPKFLNPQNHAAVLSAAQKGTVIHCLMEHIDLKKTYTENLINAELERLLKQQIITKEEKNIVDINKILNFFNSSIGQSLRAADKIYKEESFAMELSPYEVYGNHELKNAAEGILIHGIIDCFFITGKDIIIYDYKTDYTTDLTGITLAKRYKTQLDIYQKAVERILNRKVTKKYIYSFFLDKAIEL